MRTLWDDEQEKWYFCVGDVVEVRVLGVDLKKKRISLSMKGIR